MSDRQVEDLAFFLNYCQGNHNGLEVRRFCGMENHVDTSLPQAWFDECLNLNIEPRDYVWDYREKSIFGKPTNMSKEFLNTISLKLQIR